jgi:ubiquinone biosynthesis monooxygenase Coq7
MNSPSAHTLTNPNKLPQHHTPQATDSACPTVYFDGACPVCSREIAMYQRQPGAEHVRWVDVARCSTDELGPNLNREAALARLHLRRADGALVSGAEAFTSLWQALPRWAWLGRLLSFRPVLWLLEGAYRAFLWLRRTWRPAEPSAISIGTAPAITLPKAIVADLRTDHAGETGAVFIYRGVLRFARDPALRDFAQRHLATEQSHLERIEGWLAPADRSRLLPLWRLSGWLTGALPALVGPRAVYATIEAVETFVDQHYEEQVQRLNAMGITAQTQAELGHLRATLVECQGDEVAHRDEAAQCRGQHAPTGLLRAWCGLVGFGSRTAVGVCRHL